ncbi:MAG: DNA polymerase I [Bacillota bacterium]|nr:DNA polymerase I [Bacillota bacterium]
MNKEKLLILDGNSLMNRAFYAMPPMNTNSGLHTNAIYGFTTMLFKMVEEIKPDYIVSTFDVNRNTFRHKEYEDYKAGRRGMADELREQFPVVKDMLRLLSINIYEEEGFEADDLIGTLSEYAKVRDIDVYIVTGDKDALQLCDDNVFVVITKKGISEKEIYDKDRMISEFGVTPTEFIDVKGLMGDASDNIPGVPGIGSKTAFKLIGEYKSIENVLDNVDNISGKKIKESLIEYREQAIFSKKLATIMKNVPIDIDLDSIKSKKEYDAAGLRKLFVDLEFRSLLSKLPSENKKIETESECIKISDLDRIKEIIEGSIFINYLISDENVLSKMKLNKLYLGIKDKVYILDLNDETDIKPLKDVFEDEKINKTAHNMKNLLTSLRKLDIDMKGQLFDTNIAAYLIDASKGNYSVTDLVQYYLMAEIKGEQEEIKTAEASKLNELYSVLTEKLNELDLNNLFYNVEMPLMKVLSHMEQEGFRVNRAKLDELEVTFSGEIKRTESEIYTLSEEEFNINSPKQLGKILFEKLDLPVIKKTKTGYSTNAEVLEKLRDKHPIIEKIMYYRQIAKIYSTYIEGLKAVIDSDEKIHSSFNQTLTTTGRLSSTEPNLQNIPIKYELGREIRKVFIPEENSIILSADYSQIELRVLAHIADDGNFITAFKEGIDIHTKTASEVFNVPLDEVTPLLRSRAKAVNFGIVYGIGDFSLSQDLNISKKEAKLYIDTYFERYPNVKKYLTDIVSEAKEKGYVTTILNRRRYIPEINDSNKIVKSFGERLAMNTPIQGSAADIIKLAMVNVYKSLISHKLKSRIILQVHDELILNVYKEEEKQVKEIVKQEMEHVLDLKVPLLVDINEGDTWYEAK